MDYFTKKINRSLAKLPLNFNGSLVEFRLISLVKWATGRHIKCYNVNSSSAGTPFVKFYNEHENKPEISRFYWGTSHYSDVRMGAMASQITGIWTVCLVVCSGAHQRKYQNSGSEVASLHKRPVMRKMFPFDDVIMTTMINAYIFHTSQISQAMWSHSIT